MVTEDQVRQALSLQEKEGGKIVEKLIKLGYLDTTSFVRFLSKQPGTASIDLPNYESPDDLVALVPKEFAQKHEVFPIDRMGGSLTIAMVCPLDVATIEELEKSTGLRVRALLCKPEDIHKAIRRNYGSPTDEALNVESTSTVSPADVEGLEGPLRLQNVAQLIRQISSLPALPETVQRVREAMINPQSSVKDIADIVAMDPPVAANILAIANSAAYGFSRQIGDLGLAISLLGLRETYSIVTSAAVVDLFQESKCLDYKALWGEAMRCAEGSRLVAKVCGLGNRAGVFSAGLLHDIGRVSLCEVAPALYAKVGSDLAGLDLVAAEQDLIGLSHPEAGYELARHWDFPPEIAEPIRYHHNLEQASEARDIVAVVVVADVMVRTVDTEVDQNEMFFELCGSALAALNIDRERAETMLDIFRVRGESTLLP